MPSFWKSSFKCKTWFLENRVIANVNLDKKKFLELEFHELEFQKFFFFNFQFAITWLSKNRVLNWNLIFRKLSFKTRAFFWLVWESEQNVGFFKKKMQKPIFSQHFSLTKPTNQVKSKTVTTTQERIIKKPLNANCQRDQNTKSSYKTENTKPLAAPYKSCHPILIAARLSICQIRPLQVT